MVTLGVPEWRNVRLDNAEGNGECVIFLFFHLTGFDSGKEHSLECFKLGLLSVKMFSLLDCSRSDRDCKVIRQYIEREMKTEMFKSLCRDTIDQNVNEFMVGYEMQYRGRGGSEQWVNGILC